MALTFSDNYLSFGQPDPIQPQDPATDIPVPSALVDQKKQKIATASEDKKKKLDPLYTQLTDFRDGDNIGKENYRMSSGIKGESLDTWETRKSPVIMARISADPLQKAAYETKMRKQRAALQRLKGGVITNEDVYAQGDITKARKEALLRQGQTEADIAGPFTEQYPLAAPNIEFRPTGGVGKTAAARLLGEAYNPVTGVNVTKALNNPEDNADFFSKYNRAFRDSSGYTKAFSDRTASDIAKDAIGSIAGATVDLANIAPVLTELGVNVGRYLTGSGEARNDLSTALNSVSKRTKEFWKSDQRKAKAKWDKSQKFLADAMTEQTVNEIGQKFVDSYPGVKPAAEFVTQLALDSIGFMRKVADDPAILDDLITSEIPSTLTGAKIAKAAAGGLTRKFTKELGEATEDAAKDAIRKKYKKQIAKRQITAGSAMGALEESTMAVVDFTDKVQSAKDSALQQNSQEYADLRKSGLSEAEAKREVIAITGGKLFAATTAMTLATSKLLGSPVETRIAGNAASAADAAARPVGLVSSAIRKVSSGVKDSAKEAVEEAIQNPTGQVFSNLAEQEAIDNKKQVSEGVGEALVQGTLGGGLVGGTLPASTSAVKAGLNATEVVGRFAFAAGKRIYDNRQINNSARELQRSGAQEVQDVTAKVTEQLGDSVKTLDPKADGYDPSVALETLASVQDSYNSPVKIQAYIKEADSHLARLKADKKVLDEIAAQDDATQFEKDNAAAKTQQYTEAKQAIQQIKDSVRTAPEDSLQYVNATVRDPKADTYNPKAAIDQFTADPPVQHFSATPESRETLLKELSTHAENLSKKTSAKAAEVQAMPDGSSEKILGLAALKQEKKALNQALSKIDQVQKLFIAKAKLEGAAVTPQTSIRERVAASATTLKNSAKDAVESTTEGLRGIRETRAYNARSYEETNTPKAEGYAADLSYAKSITKYEQTQDEQYFNDAARHVQNANIQAAKLIKEKGDDSEEVKVAYQRANKLSADLEKFRLARESANADAESPIEITQENEKDIPDIIHGSEPINFLDAVDKAEANGVELSDASAAAVHAVREYQEKVVKNIGQVSEEVLGAGINKQGKLGLQAHMNAFDAALAVKDLPAARQVYANLKKFIGSQNEKLKQTTYTDTQGNTQTTSEGFRKIVAKETAALQAGLEYMAVKGKEAITSTPKPATEIPASKARIQNIAAIASVLDTAGSPISLEDLQVLATEGVTQAEVSAVAQNINKLYQPVRKQLLDKATELEKANVPLSDALTTNIAKLRNNKITGKNLSKLQAELTSKYEKLSEAKNTGAVASTEEPIHKLAIGDSITYTIRGEPVNSTVIGLTPTGYKVNNPKTGKPQKATIKFARVVDTASADTDTKAQLKNEYIETREQFIALGLNIPGSLTEAIAKFENNQVTDSGVDAAKKFLQQFVENLKVNQQRQKEQRKKLQTKANELKTQYQEAGLTVPKTLESNIAALADVSLTLPAIDAIQQTLNKAETSLKEKLNNAANSVKAESNTALDKAIDLKQRFTDNELTPPEDLDIIISALESKSVSAEGIAASEEVLNELEQELQDQSNAVEEPTTTDNVSQIAKDIMALNTKYQKSDFEAPAELKNIAKLLVKDSTAIEDIDLAQQILDDATEAFRKLSEPKPNDEIVATTEEVVDETPVSDTTVLKSLTNPTVFAKAFSLAASGLSRAKSLFDFATEREVADPTILTLDQKLEVIRKLWEAKPDSRSKTDFLAKIAGLQMDSKSDMKWVRRVFRAIIKEEQDLLKYDLASEKIYTLTIPERVSTALLDLAAIPIASPVISESRAKLIQQYLQAVRDDSDTVDEMNQNFAVAAYEIVYSKLKRFDPLPNIQNRGNKLIVSNNHGRSIFSKIPNLFDVMNDGAKRLAILKAMGMENDTNSLAEFFDILAPMSEEFGKMIEFFKADKNDRNFEDSAVRDISNFAAEAKFSNNINDAAAIAMFEWLGTRARDTLFNTPDDVRRLLGLAEDTSIPPSLLFAGDVYSNVAEVLGKSVRKSIGIVASDDTVGTHINELDMGLGQAMLTVMEKLGYITISSASAEDLAELTGTEARNKKAKTLFVRLKDQTEDDPEGSDYEPNALAQTLLDSHEENKEIIEKIFGFKTPEIDVAFSPVEKVMEFMKNSVTKVSDAVTKGVASAQQVVWQAKPTHFEHMDWLGKDRFLAIDNYQPDISTEMKAMEPNIEGSNRSTLTAYDKMIEFRDRVAADGKALDVPIYFTYSIWKVLRQGIVNNTINPQTSKMHRHSFTAKEFETVLDLKNPENSATEIRNLKLAIAEAFGQKIEVNDTDKIIEIFDTKIMRPDGKIIGTIFENDPGALEEGVIAINTHNNPDAAMRAIKLGKEKYASYDGLIALAEYSQAITNGDATYTANLFREVDGVTNGSASMNMQLPSTANLNKTRELLRKAGIYFKNDIAKTYAEYLKSPGAMDIYKTLTEIVSTIFLPQSIELNKTLIQQVLEQPNAVEAGEDVDKLFATIDDRDITQDISIANFEALTSVFESWIGTLTIEDATGAVEVTSEGRGYTKDPIMVSAYGAGVTSVVNKKIAEFIETFYERAKNAYNGSAEDKAAFAQDIDILLNSPSEAQNVLELLSDQSPDGWANFRTYALNIADIRLIGAKYDAIYGRALGNGIKDLLGELADERNVLNAAGRLQNEIFYALFIERLTERQAEVDRALNSFELDELLTEFRDEGLLPGLKHASSKGFEDAIQSLRFKKGPVLGMPEGREFSQYTKLNHSFPVHRLNFDPDNEAIYLPLNEEDDYQQSVTNQIQLNYPIPDPGVTTVLNANISQDANTQAILMADYVMGNIFDAQYAALNKIDEIAGSANKAWFGNQYQWSMATEMQQKLDLAIEAISQIKSAKTKKYLISDIFNRKVVGNKNYIRIGITDGAPLSFKDIGGFQAYVQTWETRIAQARYELFEGENSIVSVNQYANYQTPYEVNIDDFTGAVAEAESTTEEAKDIEQGVEDLFNESLGSEEGQYSLNRFVEDFRGKLTASTAEMLFNRLAGLASEGDSQEQTERLRGILEGIINPALLSVDQYMIATGALDNILDRNVGWITEGEVYISSTKGFATNAVNMSAQEVLVHELIHAITKEAIENNPVLRKELERLFKQAEDQLTYEHFLRKDENGEFVFIADEQAERDAAKARYDYIFNTADNAQGYLHEFMAHGLANEAFNTALRGLDYKAPANEPATTFMEAITNFMAKVVNWFTSYRVKNTKQTNIASALENLASNSNNILESNKAKLQRWNERFNQVESKAKQKLMDLVIDPYVKLAMSRAGTPRSAPRLFVETILSAPAYAISAEFRAALKQVSRNTVQVQKNILTKLINLGREIAVEVRGPTPETQKWHNFVRESKRVIDGIRDTTSGMVKKQVRSFFDPTTQLSKNDWKLLNIGVIKTKLYALADNYTRTELTSLFSDASYRNQEIGRLHDSIADLGTTATKFYIEMAISLGSYMARGTVGVNGHMMNPYLIANMGFTGIGDNSKAVEAEPLIERLATLYAIQFTTKSTKDFMSEILQKEYSREVEINGVEMLMAQHKDFDTESLDKLFGGNKIATINGWTHEKFDEMYQLDVSTDPEDSGLIARGYTRVNKLKKAQNDTGEDRYLYVNKDGILNPYQSGGVGLQNTVAKGFDLLDAADQTGKPNHAYTYAALEKIALDKSTLMDLQDIYNGSVKVDFEQAYRAPVYAANGQITTYRYLMSEEAKTRLLGKEDLAHETMGRMVASIQGKLNTDAQNRKALEMAKEDYLQARKDGQLSNYVLIGENSDDPRLREIYRMMPSNMKQDLKQIWKGQKNIYLDKDLVNMVFGFRKFSATNAIGNTGVLPVPMRRVMQIAGRVWQEIVKLAKRKIVILTPAVLIANVISNIMLSLARGVPPAYIVKHQLQGIAALNKYQKDAGVRDELVRRLKLKPNMSSAAAVKNRIARLDESLKANLVSKLMDKGVFQSIVDDVDIGDQGDISNIFTAAIPGLKNSIERYETKIPGIIKDGYKFLTIAPDTRLGNFLMKATQYSDFVARYAMYKYRTEIENKSEQETLEEVVDIFVNYDENTSQAVQYLNDMGIMMYTKFLFRIQRTILRTAVERPGSALLLAAMQIFLLDVPDIAESNFITNNFIERMRTVGNPDTLDDAFTWSIFNYIPVL